MNSGWTTTRYVWCFQCDCIQYVSPTSVSILFDVCGGDKIKGVFRKMYCVKTRSRKDGIESVKSPV